jgi:hypothetical protein
VHASQSFSERFLPPLFFAFLVLSVLGSAAVLLWTMSGNDEYVLTSEELSVLEGTAPLSTNESATRASVDPVADAVSETAGLRVETVLPGAIVSIDGEVMGVTPFQMRNMPSRWHIVSLERPGFTAIDTLVFLEEQALTSLSMTLAPAAPDIASAPSVQVGGNPAEEDATPTSSAPAALPPAEESVADGPPPSDAALPSAPAFGSISVAVNPPGVPVQLDGQTVGVAPLELTNVAPGPRTLTFFLPGYETATVSIDVKPGASEVIDIAMVPQTGTLVVVARPWGSIYVNGELHARDTDVSVEVVLPVGSHQVRVVHPSLGAQERTIDVQPERTTTASFDLN